VNRAVGAEGLEQGERLVCPRLVEEQHELVAQPGRRESSHEAGRDRLTG